MDIKMLEIARADKLLVQPSSIYSRVRVKKIIGSLIRNRSVQLLKKSLSQKSYLNLGCGGNLLKDFINMDYGWCQGIDLCWDVNKGIPLNSDSLEGVVTEHTLEHFTWEEAIKTFLPECFRVLKRGGIIRISVPDSEMCLEKYQKAKANSETEIPFRSPFDGGNRIPLTPMMEVNNTFRRIYESLNVGHKFAYDFQTLEYFLYCVGFVDITKENYMQGRDRRLLVDYKKRAGESLYVEATKP